MQPINWPDSVPYGTAEMFEFKSFYSRFVHEFGKGVKPVSLCWALRRAVICVLDIPYREIACAKQQARIWNLAMEILGYTEVYYE